MSRSLIAGDPAGVMIRATFMKMKIRHFWFSLIVLAQVTFAQAIPLRGDWESSGDLPAVYRPVYPYAYDCQIEVSDLRQYPVAGEDRRIYAVARVQLDQDSHFVRGEDLKWVPTLAGEETPPDLVIPYDLHGILAALAFQPGKAPEQDVVQLYVQVGLQVAGYEIRDDGRGEALRSESRLHARASVGATPIHGGDRPWRALYAECRKLR